MSILNTLNLSSLIPTAPSNGFGRKYIDRLQSRFTTPKKGVKGIGGFLFDYAGEARSEQTCDITDHYAEDNTPLQDHIAVRPQRIVLRGFSGELVQTAAQERGLFGSLQTALTRIQAYTGKYTPGGLSKIQGVVTKAQQLESKLNATIAQGKGLVSMLPGGAAGQTAQQKAYAYIKSYQEDGIPVSVVTPWQIYANMAIESIIAVQSEGNEYVTDFAVTLKQMRFTSVATKPYNPADFSGRTAGQSAGTANLGKTPGTSTNQSLLSSMFGAGK